MNTFKEMTKGFKNIEKIRKYKFKYRDKEVGGDNMRNNIPYYVSIGTNDHYPYIPMPSPDLRTAIRGAVVLLTKENISLYAIGAGVRIYLGRCQSHLKDAHICTLMFPKLAKLGYWVTSTEMCGLDVSLKKRATRPQFIEYAWTLRNWRWEIDTSYEEYIGDSHKKLVNFKYSQYESKEECRKLGECKIPLTMKLINKFDKYVNADEAELTKEMHV